MFIVVFIVVFFSIRKRFMSVWLPWYTQNFAQFLAESTNELNSKVKNSKFSFFFNIFYLLCYYSCPIFPSLIPLHTAPLPPATSSPHHGSSCPWVVHISSLASTFPTLFLTSPCLFYSYHLCYLFSVPFPPFFPLPPHWWPSMWSPFLWFCSCYSCLFTLFLLFLGLIVDSCEFVVILLFLFLIFLFS